MDPGGAVCGSVGLSTNRIIKTTVSVECSFELVRGAAMGAEDTLGGHCAASILIL